MFFAFVATSLILLQAAQQSPPSPIPSAEEATRPAAQQPGDFVLHLTTREVLIDLIALDDRNHPVLDLKPSDLTVFDWSARLEVDPAHTLVETRVPPDAETVPVSSLHSIDPAAAQKSGSEAHPGVQISVSCLERSTLHYQLAFGPGEDGQKSGYHRIVITTPRKHVRLFYRHNYYVGLTAPPAVPLTTQNNKIEQLLQRAACFYPDSPLSINIVSRQLNTSRPDTVGYAVTVNGNSLSNLTFRGDEPASGTQQDSQANLRRVQLDYAACTFDGNGNPVSFFHAPVDQVLTDKAYSRALVDGFPHVLQFPRADNIAVTRFVVRDRLTGNLGAINDPSPAPVQSPPIPANVAFMTKTNLQAIKEADEAQGLGGTPPKTLWGFIRTPDGPIGSFGSIVVIPDSFCGDVYELHRPSDHLPDFRELDPIGSIYTSTLDVPNQNFSNTTGIPGVTPRTDLFGIDYLGRFWVNKQGEYQFLMLSDDGARLEIDDKEIMNLDGIHSAAADIKHVRLNEGPHTIHIPYYQGAPASVALALWVKSPGQKQWTIFDLHDFTENSQPAQ